MVAGERPARMQHGCARGYSSYIATYVERDVRQVLAVRDLVQFQSFLKLVASRVGQLLNLASLAADAAISVPTARQWLSVLEAGHVVKRVAPWFQNAGKRLVKTPKLYFADTLVAGRVEVLLVQPVVPGLVAVRPVELPLADLNSIGS